MALLNNTSLRKISNRTTCIFVVITVVLVLINVMMNSRLSHVRAEWTAFLAAACSLISKGRVDLCFVLAWTMHETRNSFTNPFFCSEFCEGVEYRPYFDRAAQAEQNLLQEKGMRKNCVFS